MKALEAILKKGDAGIDLSPIEHVIYWVMDDETENAVEAAQNAAAELAEMRAVIEAARKMWKTMQEISSGENCDNDGRGCNNEDVAREFIDSHPELSAVFAKMDGVK